MKVTLLTLVLRIFSKVQRWAGISVAVGLFATTTAWGDADRLGQDLTPLGGEKAGNEAGTIPAWEGGLTTPPSDFQPGGPYTDPYAEDKILFTIDASNANSYVDQLSTAHQYMLKNYPNFRMPIYPTRRSASAPQYVYDATKAQVGRVRLDDGGNGVIGAAIGIPFPFPKTGIEVMWNHLLRYRGVTLEVKWDNAVVTSGGNYGLFRDHVKVMFRYSQPDMTAEKLQSAPLKNVMILFKSKYRNAGPKSGNQVLVHETINQVQDLRRAWTYRSGERRVRRAPNIVYDYTPERTGGLRFVDQLDMYNGAPNLYSWKLLGTREIYVPYNSLQARERSTQLLEVAVCSTPQPRLLTL